MDDDELDAIEARAEASGGPWEMGGSRTARRTYYHIHAASGAFLCPVAAYAFDDAQRLIEQANSVPTLLAEIRGLRATVDALVDTDAKFSCIPRVVAALRGTP